MGYNALFSQPRMICADSSGCWFTTSAIFFTDDWRTRPPICGDVDADSFSHRGAAAIRRGEGGRRAAAARQRRDRRRRRPPGGGATAHQAADQRAQHEEHERQ